jgi:hypothetical protein
MPSATLIRPTRVSRGRQRTTSRLTPDLLAVRDVRALLRTLPPLAASERLRRRLLAIPGDAATAVMLGPAPSAIDADA